MSGDAIVCFPELEAGRGSSIVVSRSTIVCVLLSQSRSLPRNRMISAGGPLAARALRRGFRGLCCSTASYPPFLVAHRARASRWRLGSQRTLPPASGRHAIWLDRRQMAATAFTPRRPVAGMGRHWTTGPPAHTSSSLTPLLAPCDHSVSCCRPSLFWNLER